MEHLFNKSAPDTAAPSPSEFSEDERSLYHVPGHPPIDDRDLSRYRRSQSILTAHPAAQPAFPSFPSADKAEPSERLTVEELIASSDRSRQRVLMRSVARFPMEERTKLVTAGLSSDFPEVQCAAMIGIPSIPVADRPAMNALAAQRVKTGLESDSNQKQYAVAINFLPRIYWPALIQVGFDVGSVEARAACLELVRSLPSEERSFFREQIFSLVHRGLHSAEAHVSVASAEMIANAQIEDRAALIEEGLSIDRPEVQSTCTELLHWLDEGTYERQRALLPSRIISAFASDSAVDQRMGARMIASAPLESVRGLVERGIALSDPDARRISLQALNSLPKGEVSAILVEALKTGGRAVERSCLAYIKGRSNILREMPALAEMLYTDFADSLVEPALYKRANITDEGPISRTPFAKTGYDTTLLGGKLKGKVIIRRLEEHAFRAWKWLYEQHAYWKENGFDYVPIEPIVSFRQNNKGLIDVATGVLDLSLYDWNEMGGRFGKELQDDRDRIAEAVSHTGIEHLDIADRNFCLRFFRNEKGKADLTRKPRLYLIDFDHVSRR